MNFFEAAVNHPSPTQTTTVGASSGLFWYIVSALGQTECL